MTERAIGIEHFPPMPVLLPEAAEVLEARGAHLDTTPLESRIDTINRGVRASLNPKKPTTFEELYGTQTNCYGAIGTLLQVATQHGIPLRPAIVERYPWQEPEANREIHIVAAHIGEANQAIVADPMPLPSYSCGTTRTGQCEGDTIVSYDPVLGGDVTYKLLDETETWAIGHIFEADIVGTQDPYKAALMLVNAYRYLEEVPAYRVRVARTMYKYPEYREGALHLFAQQSPHHILGQYAKYLSPGPQVDAVKTVADAQQARQEELLAATHHAALTAPNLDKRNYWLRVLEDFSHIPRDPSTQASAEAYSHRDFAHPPDGQSIRRYEQFMTTHYPRYIQSNLYTCEW